MYNSNTAEDGDSIFLKTSRGMKTASNVNATGAPELMAMLADGDAS